MEFHRNSTISCWGNVNSVLTWHNQWLKDSWRQVLNLTLTLSPFLGISNNTSARKKRLTKFRNIVSSRDLIRIQWKELELWWQSYFNKKKVGFFNVWGRNDLKAMFMTFTTGTVLKANGPEFKTSREWWQTSCNASSDTCSQNLLLSVKNSSNINERGKEAGYKPSGKVLWFYYFGRPTNDLEKWIIYNPLSGRSIVKGHL